MTEQRTSPVLTIDRFDLVVDVSPYDCSPSLETK